MKDTGIAEDYRAVAIAWADSTSRASLEFEIEVSSVRRSADGRRRSQLSRRLVACAGLQSDRIARLAGLPVKHRIVPFRGEYYTAAALEERHHPQPDLSGPGSPTCRSWAFTLTRMIDWQRHGV